MALRHYRQAYSLLQIHNKASHRTIVSDVEPQRDSFV
jgi:hypothetical protein